MTLPDRPATQANNNPLRRLPEDASVLVSDFDGTLARPDFYQLVRQRLVPDTTPNFWEHYWKNEITHFDALKGYFLAAEGGEAALREITQAMELPQNLCDLVARLRAAGWAVVIVSAGCQWYIDLLLKAAGVQLPVIANPGRVEHGRLLMERPVDSPFYCYDVGVDKSAVVRALQARHAPALAFAGDGLPDLPASRLVEPSYRFARADLADACRREGLSYRPFATWDQIVDQLLAGS